MNHIYTLDGTKILCEAWGDNTIIPLYDNEDGVCGIVYNDEPFYFQKNLQGDIIAIMNKDAHSVAKYSYDAWGVCTVTQDASDIAIATVNPYRYRGYYYDPEIGMCYLQSRYYNPAVGRFVNGDDTCAVIFFNLVRASMVAYCFNDPINGVDYCGYGQATLNAVPTCPSNFKKAITHSGLNMRRGSLLDQKGVFYGGCVDIGNGFYICSFYHYISPTFRKITQYLVGAMTRDGWNKYTATPIKDDLSYFMQGFNEVLGMLPNVPDNVTIAGFFIEQILSIESFQRKYIRKMLGKWYDNSDTNFDCCGRPIKCTQNSGKLIYIAMSVHSEEQMKYSPFWGGNWHTTSKMEYTAW